MMIRWTPEAQNELASLLSKGWRVREIAGSMGSTKPAIAARMRHTGLRSQSFGRAVTIPPLSDEAALRERWRKLLPEMKRRIREDGEAGCADDCCHPDHGHRP